MKLLLGDCIEKMKELPDNSVDSIVTDPPYGLSFMGKKWDYDVPSVEIWQECLRVLKSGGHLLSFGGTRTYHRMSCAIDDAGFEIRDMIGWLYASGFPKSHNIGKAVDKIQGNERENLGLKKGNSQWEGWGTALKPAHEPIVMARKPLSENNIAQNVLKHGTGGINIDGCRIGYSNNETDNRIGQDDKHKGAMGKAPFGKKTGKDIKINTYKKEGRFPANLIHDGSDEVVGIFPENANRFFYCAKSGVEDRNEGLEVNKNFHPTVKPTKLMQYLVRLVTPKGGVVLDPFMGSGSTGKACVLEGMDFVGIEKEKEYYEIAKARIKYTEDNKIQTLF